MKAFVYRLEGVFKAKTALRDSKAADLARVRQKLLDQQERLRSIANRLHSVLEEDASTKSPLWLQQRETYVASLKRKYREQQREVAILSRDVEQCQDALMAAEVERKKYEKHKQRDYELWQHQFRREEEKRIEDASQSGRRCNDLQASDL